MEAKQASVTKQTLYLTVIIVFIAGFLSGVAFTVFKKGAAGGGAPVSVAQQGAPSSQESEAILNLEGEVTANPDNYNAWTQLGHLYFDTDQYQKAIGAYTKSLALHPGNANLWTDLGVMYRRAGQPEKAVESFDKAIEMDPTHKQSRFNKGIVLHFDLGRTAEALAIWQSLLAIDPNYMTANNTPLKALVEQLQQSTTN